MRALHLSLLTFLSALLTACGSGQYGHSRQYVVLDTEEAHAMAAQDLGYEEVKRFPRRYLETSMGWFGVVTDVEPVGDQLKVRMTFRTHRARHLCADETEGSCRVTVSHRPGGEFVVTLTPRADERDGSIRIWPGSLLRTYGSPTGEMDGEAVVMTSTFHRHWPTGTYVTTAQAAHMRR